MAEDDWSCNGIIPEGRYEAWDIIQEHVFEWAFYDLLIESINYKLSEPYPTIFGVVNAIYSR